MGSWSGAPKSCGKSASGSGLCGLLAPVLLRASRGPPLPSDFELTGLLAPVLSRACRWLQVPSDFELTGLLAPDFSRAFFASPWPSDLEQEAGVATAEEAEEVGAVNFGLLGLFLTRALRGPPRPPCFESLGLVALRLLAPSLPHSVRGPPLPSSTSSSTPITASW